MHKRRIGTVFKQAAHQISQQIAVRANRRVNAATDQRVFQHFTEDAFAHAVQALQFKRHRVASRHLQNRSNRAGVVAGKLRVNGVGRFQQSSGAGQVAHVGVVLVGKNRVVRQPHFLRALDL